MKNLILLFCAMMIAGLSYGQLKVVSNGNTKIGDTGTSPLGKTHITGTTTLELALDAAAGNPDFSLLAAGTVRGQVKFENSTDGLGFFVQTASAQKAIHIERTNQRVGIGTSSPATKLHVAGTISHMGLSNVSDRRLKTDIREYKGGLKEVLSIQPKYYRYNDILINSKGAERKDLNGRQEVGVIAQEIQEIAPELVNTFVHESYDYTNDDGETGPKLISEDEYLAVNTDAIKFMLVNAVKEQQEIIENQEDRIAELEAKLDEVLDLVKNNEILNLTGGKAALGQNRPNPFTNETTIDYFIPEKSSNAQIEVFNISGQLIETKLIDHTGIGNLKVNAKDMASGAYSYRLVVDGRVVGTNKMILQN